MDLGWGNVAKDGWAVMWIGRKIKKGERGWGDYRGRNRVKSGVGRKEK